MQHADTMEVDTDFHWICSLCGVAHLGSQMSGVHSVSQYFFLTAVCTEFGNHCRALDSGMAGCQLKLGIDFKLGLPTLPAPNSDGLPTKRPLSTDEMKQWLQMVFTSRGINLDGRRLTSHSCKCTLLSWLAKHGDDWADRMALGGPCLVHEISDCLQS